MAVTILERPQGRVLSTTGNTATVNSSYGTGDAIFIHIGHGLTSGDFIYTTSDIENYAGFWEVVVITADQFKLVKDPDYYNEVQYIQDGTITYYTSTLTHGWSAVHLPINYLVSSNLYPFNAVDPAADILSYVDDNGYVLLNLNGSLGTIHTFDWVELSSTDEDDLDGQYQILDWISPTVIVINLAYDSYPNLTGARVKKAYHNYNILVNVYAGIYTGHQWEDQKPYELAATLQLIPYNTGEVGSLDSEATFSINEILKSYVQTKNNPAIGTQPNNIDFWCNFYIEVAESYDDSDGYSYGTYISEYTSDESNFQGFAVNAKLEFKNVQSGFMSDYLMNRNGKFLTLFEEPVIFDIPYQDISFIKNSTNDYIINYQYYLNGAAGLFETQTITGDEGVYRLPLVANCSYDRVDIWITSDIFDIEPGTGELILTGFEPLVTIGPA